MSRVQATDPNERLHLLDVIRGFALFGVLTINIYDFSGFDYALTETKQHLPTYPLDIWAERTVKFFFEGKFYAIFSVLFGIGFSIQIERLREKSSNWRKVFYRRLLILLIFGIIHLQFLWVGDILVLYAILGFFLPLFVNASDREVFLWGVGLLLSPVLIDAILIWNDFHPWDNLEAIGFAIDHKNGIPNDDFTWRTYPFDPDHGFKEFWKWVQPAPIYRLHGLLMDNRFPRVLGLFLIGLFLGRNKFLHTVLENVGLFRKAAIYGLFAGLPRNLIYYISGDELLKSITYSVGVPMLAIAYMAILSLMYQKSLKLLRPLASVGRMALTNYLAQTIICLFLFYNIGLGLGGEIGATYIFLIGVLIYTFQIVCSNLWLKRHPDGPLESIWRKLTYL
ncbi:MAG: DUF418 domain-containing protein [Bacteroidota bacterium]